jgi:hypothetical protein
VYRDFKEHEVLVEIKKIIILTIVITRIMVMVVITVANFCLYEILYTLEGEFLMLGCTEHISTHVK